MTSRASGVPVTRPTPASSSKSSCLKSGTTRRVPSSPPSSSSVHDHDSLVIPCDENSLQNLDQIRSLISSLDCDKFLRSCRSRSSRRSLSGSSPSRSSIRSNRSSSKTRVTNNSIKLTPATAAQVVNNNRNNQQSSIPSRLKPPTPVSSFDEVRNKSIKRNNSLTDEDSEEIRCVNNRSRHSYHRDDRPNKDQDPVIQPSFLLRRNSVIGHVVLRPCVPSSPDDESDCSPILELEKTSRTAFGTLKKYRRAGSSLSRASPSSSPTPSSSTTESRNREPVLRPHYPRRAVSVASDQTNLIHLRELTDSLRSGQDASDIAQLVANGANGDVNNHCPSPGSTSPLPPTGRSAKSPTVPKTHQLPPPSFRANNRSHGVDQCRITRGAKVHVSPIC